MKKLLPLLAILALTAACNDDRVYVERDWYLSGGGEQQLFRQITVIRSDFGGSPSSSSKRTKITVSSDRTVKRVVTSLSASGAEKGTICEGQALLGGIEYQGVTSLAMEAGLLEYTDPIESTCPESFTFIYQISYELMDGKSVTFSSEADTCPFSEPMMAIINRVEEVASDNIAECLPAEDVSADDDVEEEPEDENEEGKASKDEDETEEVEKE